MKRIGIRPEAKKALVIGLMCSLSYLAVYVARNALSAASPVRLADFDLVCPRDPGRFRGFPLSKIQKEEFVPINPLPARFVLRVFYAKI